MRSKTRQIGLLALAAAVSFAGCSTSNDSADTAAVTEAAADSASSDTNAANDTSAALAAETTGATDTTSAPIGDTIANTTSTATGGTFTYASPEPGAIDPQLVSDVYGAELVVQVVDGLTDVAADLSIVPAVSTEWKASADAKTWTFTLRDDSMFSNGRKVVAGDFVYGFARAADPDLASPVAYQGLPIAGWGDAMGGKASGAIGDVPVSGVRAIDDRTLEITTAESFALLPKILIHPIFSPIPKEAVDTEAKAKAFAEQPIGNGPFVVASPWEHNTQIVLERNPGYKGTNPAKAAKIVARLYASTETSFRDVQAGNIDASETPVQLLGQAKTEFGERLVSAPLPTVGYIGFPVATAPFDNLALRRAISLAIDRATIAQTSLGSNTPLTTFTSKSAPLVTSSCPDLTLDATTAKALYKESGGLPGDVLEFTYPTGPEDSLIKAIANDLRNNLGITVNLKPMEFAPFVEALRAKTIKGVYALGWAWDYPSAYNFLSPLYESTSGDNNLQYKSAAFDALMQKIRTAPDEAAGAPAINEALDLLCKDLPSAPTFGSSRDIALREGVSGLGMDGLGFLTLGTVEVAA